MAAGAFGLMLAGLAMRRAEGDWTRRIGQGIAFAMIMALLRFAYRQITGDQE